MSMLSKIHATILQLGETFKSTFYTKSEVDDLIDGVGGDTALEEHKDSNDHDGRYYTQSQTDNRIELAEDRANNLTEQRYGQAVDEIIKTDVQFALTGDDVGDLLGTEQSMEEIFNNWFRFSRAGSPSNLEANAAELEGWELDSEANNLRCTLNTATYVGFVSPGKYENYILETQVTSTDGDDDDILVIAAFVVDSNGVSHSLDISFSLRHISNGLGPIAIWYNHYANNNIMIETKGSPLTWADGESGDSPAHNGTRGGWSQVPNGFRSRITRDGDDFTFEITLTNEGDTDDFHPDLTMTLNLDDHPELSIFKGPQSYGYSCRSQRHSTWNIIRKPSDLADVIDLENQVIWQFIDDEWSDTSIDDIFDYVTPNRFYRTGEQLVTVTEQGQVITFDGQLIT